MSHPCSKLASGFSFHWEKMLKSLQGPPRPHAFSLTHPLPFPWTCLLPPGTLLRPPPPPPPPHCCLTRPAFALGPRLLPLPGTFPQDLMPGSPTHFKSLLTWCFLSEAFPGGPILNDPLRTPNVPPGSVLPISKPAPILLCILLIYHVYCLSYANVSRGFSVCLPMSPQHMTGT